MIADLLGCEFVTLELDMFFTAMLLVLQFSCILLVFRSV